MSSSVLPGKIGSAPPPVAPTPDREVVLGGEPRRFYRYRLGLQLYLVSVLMLFVGFSSAYVVRRGIATWGPGTGAYATTWEPLQLPIPLLFVNTVLLVLGSVCLEVPRRMHSKSDDEGARRNYRWILLSFACAAAFAMGQLLAWHKLRVGGSFLSTGARTAFFYVLSGTHLFHTMLGAACLGYLAFRFGTLRGSSRRAATDLAAWYMHAMAALWIYLFCFLTWA